MNCATSTIKYLVFIFNTLCALVALAAVVIFSIAVAKGPSDQRTGAIIFIVISACVVLISFCGCFGAIKKNSCLTWMYVIFMILLIIANLIVQFTGFYNANPDKQVQQEIDRRWQEQMDGKDGMASYQTTLECCGRKGPSDYTALSMTIPDSCYPKGQVNNPTALYKTGCIQALSDLYTSVLKLSKTFLWVTFGIEVAGAVCGLILAIAFHNERRRANY